MKTFQLIIVVFLLLTPVSGTENYFDWTDGVDESKWLKSVPVRAILTRMTRKPRPRQFIGLMGKRASVKAQITRKRQKFESFVGLMGKRGFEEHDSF